jgi:hypothetical protein
MNGQKVIPRLVPGAPRSSGKFKGIASSALIVILCLPSLVGAAALILQVALHQNISEWNETAAALIALGSLVGGPFVAMAALIGGIVTLTQLPSGFKYADLCVVGTAALAAMSLLLTFAK